MANDFLKNINLSSFSQADDLKKRIFFTLAVLFFYRLGCFIPIPGLDPLAIQEIMSKHMKGLLGMLDMMSGGSLSHMAIFALNVMPYISASIIIQVMSYAYPPLATLRKDGMAGRKKLNQYTRYLTIGIAAVQAWGICAGMTLLKPNPVTIGAMFPVIGVPTLVCGTMLVMWLGEQITSRGIGNGVSILICAGILANIPRALERLLEMGRSGIISIPVVIFVLVAVLALVVGIVYVEKAQRRVKFMYPSKRGGGMQGNGVAGDTTHLPLKLNASGVIPPIFAQALLGLPAVIINFISQGGEGEVSPFVQKLASFLSFGNPVFTLLFASLIIFFAFFYTAIVFNSEETAENLKKSGGFVPGVRPGSHTADYFDYILTRITVFGSLYLAVICILPQVIMSYCSIHAYLSGTSILIVVSVLIDTITHIYTRLLSHQYRGLFKKHQKRMGGK